jgi:hypothetical protein
VPGGSDPAMRGPCRTESASPQRFQAPGVRAPGAFRFSADCLLGTASCQLPSTACLLNPVLEK